MFRSFLDDKEEKQVEKEINEDAITLIGSLLGYGTLMFILAFGGTLVIAGGVKAVTFLRKWWAKIIKEVKGEKIKDPQKMSKDMKIDPMIRQERNKIENAEKKYEEDLKKVNIAIMNKDFKQAKEEFDELEPRLKNLPDVRKIIITEIVKSTKEPPLYVQSPGNISYRAIKTILGIRTARAAAEATKMAIEKNLSK